MHFRPIPVWVALAASIWIAFDVGRGAMSGIADARQKQRASKSLGDIVQEVAKSYRDRYGDNWTKHAKIRSVTARGSALTFKIALTPDAKASIAPRWAKNRIVGMRHDIRKRACRDEALGYLLSRGGQIMFQSTDGRVANLLPTRVPVDYC